MRSPSANHRFRVWNAIGMMMAHAGEPSRDALARLRGYAFSHNLTLDELAGRLPTANSDPKPSPEQADQRRLVHDHEPQMLFRNPTLQ